MNSLVDYCSSSSSDTDEENEEISNKTIIEEPKPVPSKLPKPEFGGTQTSVQHSVFSNPFVEAELAKAALLEKHVKMVPGKEQMQIINGKKICWNYRKGRCRFGHTCKFAHDSDILKTADEVEAEKQSLKSVVCEGSGTQTSQPPPSVVLEDVQPTSEEVWENKSNRTKLKRPGLSQGVVPGKKVLKLFKQQRSNESNKK